MSFPFFFSRFHINNLFSFLIFFPSVFFIAFFFFFPWCVRFHLLISLSLPFPLFLLYFSLHTPLPCLTSLSFMCCLLLTANIPKSISAAATWVLFLAATGGSSALFAALDSSQGKQKTRLWKPRSSNWSYPRGCVWIVCYKVSAGE